MKGASDALLTCCNQVEMSPAAQSRNVSRRNKVSYVKYISVTDLVFLTIPVSHVIQSYTTSSRASDFHLGTNDPVFHS